MGRNDYKIELMTKDILELQGLTSAMQVTYQHKLDTHEAHVK